MDFGNVLLKLVHKKSKFCFRISVVMILIVMISLVEFEYAANQALPVDNPVLIPYENTTESGDPPRNPSSLKGLVQELIDLLPPYPPDADDDGLPDVVEAIIGTNSTNNDTDHDSLTDYFEVFADSDPLEPDTNFDGLPDKHEFYVSVSDIDGDGIPNVWDFDNDGDGVNDDLDADPFRRTNTRMEFNMSIDLSGVSTYITFQLIPANVENLQLVDQFWDWPYDATGAMQDLDSSKEDVKVIPMLNITLNSIPEQTDVEDYGIQVVSNGIHVPISPVMENERVVAFSSKMFFPATEPIILMMSVELEWEVIGFTDINAIALNSSSKGYVIINSTGYSVACESSIENAALQRVICGRNQIALKEVGGGYLSVTEDGRVVASASDIDSDETFTVHYIDDTIITLETADHNYIGIGDGGFLIANASSSTAEHFNMTDLGYRPDSTLLVTYNEGFMLTGMAVEEMHSSSVGLFYSSNRNMTLAADMIIPYIFQHNSTNHLADIPSLLPDYDISLQSITDDFSHRDEALIALSNELIPSALEYLPDNENYPIIIATEDAMKTADLSDIVPESFLITGPIDLNLTVCDLVTLKSSKTHFYNTSSKSALSLMEVFDEIDSWALSENATFNIISMMLRWHTGEYTIFDPSTPTVPYSPETSLVDTVVYVTVLGLEAVGVISQGLTGWKAWKWLDSMYTKGWNKASVGRYLKTKSSSTLTQWSKVCKGLDKIDDTSKFAKSVNRLDEIMLVVGIIIDLGISIAGGIMLANSIGGSFGKAVGATFGTVSAVVSLVITGILYGIVQIPYVGWVLAIGMVIADMIGGYSDELVSWLTNVIVGDVEVYSKVTPSFDREEDFDITITDKDNNGLDANDRIDVVARIIAILNATGPGRNQGISGSHNIPKITIAPPWGALYSNTWASEPVEEESATMEGDGYTVKERTYRCEAWIEPSTGMPNFPVTLILHNDFYLNNIYRNYWLGLFPEYHYQPLSDSESTLEYATLYYDVMPDSIESFTRWRYITPLDHDHDGLNDDDELPGMAWKWDFDQDGLSDYYETIIGSDPGSADTDTDGLIDGWELNYGTNITDRDSDKDGLRDLREIAGWQVSFEFESTPFKIHVYADPRIPDSEGDGIDDYSEYWSNTNPRSYDTNGDGTWDEEKPMMQYSIEFERSWGTDQPIDTTFASIESDLNGDLYVLMGDGGYSSDSSYYPGASTWWITKLDSNLSVIPTGSYFSAFDGEPICKPVLTIDKENETLYCHDFYSYPADCMFESYSLNGSTHYGTIDTGQPWMYDASFSPPNMLHYIWDIESSGFLSLNEILTPSSWTYVWDESIPNIESDLGTLGQPISCAYSKENQLMYVACQNRVFGYDPTGTISPFLFDGTFTYPRGITISDENIIYVADTGGHSIRAFDLNGEAIPTWGINGTYGFSGYEEGNFTNPMDITVGTDGSFYVVENWVEHGRVQKFVYNSTCQSDQLVATDDSDFDGLTNEVEVAGWSTSITDSIGTHQVNVYSNPLLNDSDYDDLDDYTENQIGTDPQSIDSDGDGLSDAIEVELGTDPLHWDSDRDLLGDGTEITYGCSPLSDDTDGDELTDFTEFLLNSDANSTDTDNDGLDDKTEFDFNSSLVNADSDGDLMFDALEYEEGTNPNSLDSDGDDVVDGIEMLYGTDTMLVDTDGDRAPDGLELVLWLDPLCSDSDGDGLGDMDELEFGVNPWSNDTDLDGIPDLYDPDSFNTELLDVLIVSDSDILLWSEDFCENLDELADVSLLSSDNFTSSYRDSPYVVMIGRPKANEEGICGLMYDVLEDTGSVLQGMMQPGAHMIATRYGVWTETQTVVMLTDATGYDVYSVLAALKGKEVTVLPDTIRIAYSSCAVNASSYAARYVMDSIDAIKQTDCILAFMIDSSENVVLNVTRYAEETTPHPLIASSGLMNDEVSLGRYIDIQLTVGGTETHEVEEALVKMYYRQSDLDMNNNGLLNDTVDVNETTLVLYHFNDTTGVYTRLSTDLVWVHAWGVNTTDVEIYGELYAGYVWARVTHLSMLAIAGSMNVYSSPDQSLLMILIVSSGIIGILLVVFLIKRRKQ